MPATTWSRLDERLYLGTRLGSLTPAKASSATRRPMETILERIGIVSVA